MLSGAQPVLNGAKRGAARKYNWMGAPGSN
jgi:hypothetical protein